MSEPIIKPVLWRCACDRRPCLGLQVCRETLLFCAGLIIGGLVGLLAGRVETRTAVMSHACGECDHVGECGDYECRPGVDGWQLKAGAR